VKGTPHWIRAAAAAGLLATGCSGPGPWTSLEERVNDAVPPGSTVIQAKAKLDQSFEKDPEARARIEDEYATKLKLRALTCVQGKEPSRFDSGAEIRQQLPMECFTEFDRDLVAWMGARRLSSVLGAEALRPIPPTAPSLLTTADSIIGVGFASEAGIAVALASHSFEVIDISNDESLFVSDKLPVTPSWVAVSPNGRAIAVPRADGGVDVRDSQSDEILAQYPDHTRLTWLDSVTGFMVAKSGRGVDLLDFTTGKITAAKGLTGISSRVMRVPGHKDHFLYAQPQGFVRFELRREKSGVRIMVRDEREAPRSWGDDVSDATSDGRFFAHGGNDLALTDLSTWQTERIVVPDLTVVSAMALPDPNEILLRAALHGDNLGGRFFVVYSLKDRTFSPVEEEAFAGSARMRYTHTFYVPTLRRIGIVSGKSIRLLETVPRGPRFAPEAYIQHVRELALERQQKQAAEYGRQLGYTSRAMAGGVPVMAGAISELAEDAEIHAVGVYEAEGSSRGAGASAVRFKRPVNVMLRRSSKPIVLVLASYEAVEWRISGGSAAKLQTVLLSGYNPSTVTGAGSVRVINIGNSYAYEIGSAGYGGLQREVARWTGKTIGTFQGKYSGSTFMVGGR
jgi:hypothetical protein